MKKLTPNIMNVTEGPVISAPTAPSRPAPADEGLISREELARRLHKSIRTIANWQRRGIIPFVKIENSTWFNRPIVVAHLDKQSRVCPTPTERLLRIPVIGMTGDDCKKEAKACPRNTRMNAKERKDQAPSIEEKA